MTRRNSTAVLVAALLLAGACGSDPEIDAGASVEPGPTGTLPSTVVDVPTPDGVVNPEMTVVEGPPSASVTTAPNAPPVMTSPSTDGDTTVRQVP
jgi:hypothetical protein